MNLPTPFKNNVKSRLMAAMVILAVAGIGTYLIIGSRAATPFANINADKGTLAGCASSNTDATAGDGNKVVFGGSGCGRGGGITCSQTFGTSSTWSQVTAALAVPGSTVCLSTGTYPAETITNIAPASNSTLSAAPGQSVTIGGITLNGNPGDSNLTINGFTFTGENLVSGHGSNITFQHNTTNGLVDQSAYVALGNLGVTISGISVIYNHISNMGCSGTTGSCPGNGFRGQCFTFVGDVANITFDHNVCGPGISDHYTQTGGVQTLDEEYNTFLGPTGRYAPGAIGVHQNILQIFGSSSNINFSNNVIRDTGTNGNSLLIESTPPNVASFSNIKIDNNLFDHDADGVSIGICPINGLTFTNNTVVDQVYAERSNFAAQNGSTSDCTGGANYNISNNIFVHAASGSVTGNTTNGSNVITGLGSTAGMVVHDTIKGPGIPSGAFIESIDSASQIHVDDDSQNAVNATASGSGVTLTYGPQAGSDFSYGGSGACASSCIIDNIVTGDGSAGAAGAAHFVNNWTPSFMDTTNFQPIGLPFQAGYKGGGGS